MSAIQEAISNLTLDEGMDNDLALKVAGEILAGEATPSLLRRLGEFGDYAGTAFQIVDDILGAAGSFRELGRDPGRDHYRGKVTYPRIVGFPASHRAVDRLLGKADREVVRVGEHRPLFQGFLDLIDRRRRNEGGGLLAPKERRR